MNLAPETGGGAGRGQIGVNYGSRIDWRADSQSPTSHRVDTRPRARHGSTDPPVRPQPVTVASGDVTDIAVLLSGAASAEP